MTHEYTYYTRGTHFLHVNVVKKIEISNSFIDDFLDLKIIVLSITIVFVVDQSLSYESVSILHHLSVSLGI